MGGRGDERDDLGEVLVLVVRERVESLLGEGEDGLLEAILELALDGLVLGGERRLESSIGDGLPAIETIDLVLRASARVSNLTKDGEAHLVERNDERRLALTQKAKRLESLGLETVLFGVPGSAFRSTTSDRKHSP